MKTLDILEAMASGAILCLGYEGFEKVYWLEPRRAVIRSDIAQTIIGLPGVEPSGDGLFGATQTWKMRMVGGAKSAKKGKGMGRKKR